MRILTIIFKVSVHAFSAQRLVERSQAVRNLLELCVVAQVVADETRYAVMDDRFN